MKVNNKNDDDDDHIMKVSINSQRAVRIASGLSSKN